MVSAGHAVGTEDRWVFLDERNLTMEAARSGGAPWAGDAVPSHLPHSGMLRTRFSPDFRDSEGTVTNERNVERRGLHLSAPDSPPPLKVKPSRLGSWQTTLLGSAGTLSCADFSKCKMLLSAINSRCMSRPHAALRTRPTHEHEQLPSSCKYPSACPSTSLGS